MASCFGAPQGSNDKPSLNMEGDDEQVVGLPRLLLQFVVEGEAMAREGFLCTNSALSCTAGSCSCLSQLLFEFLQYALHGVDLEYHLEYTNGLECNGMYNVGCPYILPY